MASMIAGPLPYCESRDCSVFRSRGQRSNKVRLADHGRLKDNEFSFAHAIARINETESGALRCTSRVASGYAELSRSEKIGVRFGVRYDPPNHELVAATAVRLGGWGRN